jgi:hypothetical protein
MRIVVVSKVTRFMNANYTAIRGEVKAATVIGQKKGGNSRKPDKKKHPGKRCFKYGSRICWQT